MPTANAMGWLQSGYKLESPWAGCKAAINQNRHGLVAKRLSFKQTKNTRTNQPACFFVLESGYFFVTAFLIAPTIANNTNSTMLTQTMLAPLGAS